MGMHISSKSAQTFGYTNNSWLPKTYMKKKLSAFKSPKTAFVFDWTQLRKFDGPNIILSPIFDLVANFNSSSSYFTVSSAGFCNSNAILLVFTTDICEDLM